MVIHFASFPAKEKNFPGSHARSLEEWSLFQAITGLNESGRTLEAEALCTKVWLQAGCSGEIKLLN